LTIPAGPNDEFLIEKNSLHIWPRKQFMLIALPNFEGSFTCTLFLPYIGEKSFANLATEEAAQRFFKEEFPDAYALIPNIAHEFHKNPLGHLGTIRCFPWHFGPRVLLIGDAAHGIVPFYGQGMNAGFESCELLASMISPKTTAWQEVFSEFERERKKDTDAIADLAIRNFIEMRDHVADANFLLKKAVSKLICDKYPSFITAYSMVSFKRTPYRQALQCALVLDKMLEEICHGRGKLEDIDWLHADKLICQYLDEFGRLATS
jgi:kynurenine 3-monooxygenase